MHGADAENTRMHTWAALSGRLGLSTLIVDVKQVSARLQPSTAKAGITCWAEKVTTGVVFGSPMATVFDLAMPALDDAQNQARQRRRRADSIEIIDVDQLDDVLYQAHRPPVPGPSRSAPRNRPSSSSEVISLVDSDEEDMVIRPSDVRPGNVSFFLLLSRDFTDKRKSLLSFN